MAITVKHKFVSAIPDGTDATIVRPSNWNDDHDLVGTVPVTNGGTGATTLTGYVIGNGSAAMTASATVPSTDITGLGTMSTQNANAVAITGGTIDGTTIGATTTSTGKFTTLNASTSLTTPIVQASNSGGLSLKNSAGTTQISMGAGGGDNASINVSTNINGTNAQIDISPTGTGHVHINPTGVNSIQIAPTYVGTMDNMTIGATTPKNGSFVDLSVTGAVSFDTLQGTVGQVLTSAGTGNTPTWTTPTTGTVTSVTGTSPVVSSGGNTPAISMPAANTTTNGYLTSADWNTFSGKGTGSVTSVALALPSIFSVTGSPVTTTGTLTGALTTQTAATVFAGPATGAAATPTFRAIVATDIPTLNQNTTGTAANVTGIVLGANGGTGVANTGSTITLGGNLTTSGAFATTLTSTATTALTLPASGYLISTVTNMAANPVTGTPSASNFLRGDGTWANPTAGLATYTRTNFTATAGQTSFTVTYTVGYVQVYINGVLLDTTDYTSTSGTAIVLATAAALNDIVTVIAYNTTTATTAAGSTTQVQYNSGGNFAGSANLTFDGTTLTGAFSGTHNGTVGATTPSTVVATQLTVNGSNLNTAISPTGTGTVTIAPAGATTLGTAGVATTMNGNISATASNQTITLSPTGTGTVAISPAGALTINPTAASTINNTSIGATTASTGAFTTLSATTAIALTSGGTGSTTAAGANANLQGYTTTATAAGTTTLTNTSTYYQYFTGTSAQTVKMPVTSTLQTGWSFHIANNSTVAITLQSSGANTIGTIPPQTTAHITCIGTALTTAADWDFGYTDFGTLLGNDGAVPMSAQWYLSAPITAFGPTINNFFGANSAVSLDASGTYDIEVFCYFLKSTAGTVTWGGLFSSAPTVCHAYLEYTPVTGFTTSLISGSMVTAEQTAQAIANMAFAATASLTTAVYHIAKFRIRVTTNAACNFRLNITQSAGTVTPQAGSWYTARKIATNSGTFVA